MDIRRDLFISHASADNENYILPLARALDTHGVSYWLDNKDITYGDVIISSLSQGLRQSQYVLLCLSSSFLKSHWAKHEMSAALSAQNDSGEKKVLPLFLNSKDEILNEF